MIPANPSLSRSGAPSTTSSGSVLSRFLRLFGDVRPEEVTTTLLMLSAIFSILAGYYLCKTAREPLILLSGGAEVKTYASAGQAVLLMGFVPLYGWFASRVDRIQLLIGVSLFFVVNLELFALAGTAGVPYVGLFFYIWVGIFSTAIIAQFWSYGNDLFDKRTGERLFPIIGIGATLGSPLGAQFAESLFKRGASPYMLLHLAAICLLVSMGIYWLVERREGSHRAHCKEPLPPGPNGFALILNSTYLRDIALLLLVLNVVNTTGEYILSASVLSYAREQAAVTPGFNASAYVGAFYGDYFFWVNIIAVVLQSFVASRLVKKFGLKGVLFVLPIVALGAYSMVAIGAALMIVRAAKTAENATDYSIMNVTRQLLWLPTSRDEKYKAKQAADTFVVRLGDVVAAGVVWLGTQVIGVGYRGFAVANLALICVWLLLAVMLYREYQRRAAQPVAA